MVPELIILVCSHLRIFETEPLARTFNKRLYLICLPFLALCLTMQHNVKRMISICGMSCDYLDPNHASWFTPLDDLTAKVMQHFHQGPAASSTQVHLRNTLGLPFPGSSCDLFSEIFWKALCALQLYLFVMSQSKE